MKGWQSPIPNERLLSRIGWKELPRRPVRTTGGLFMNRLSVVNDGESALANLSQSILYGFVQLHFSSLIVGNREFYLTHACQTG